MARARAYSICLIFSFLVLLGSGAVAQKPPPDIKVPTQTKELSAKEIAKIALPSVVLLICDDPATKGVVQGSGFFVKPGILVTNYHVIKGNTRGVVQVALGSKREKRNFRIATVVAYDEESDLAILSIPTAKAAKVPFLSLALENESVDVGETVYALGNPEGLVGTISPGIVSANLRSSQKKARLQITAPISHGSSGGPIVNNKGAVIGVAVGSLSEGQNLNFAVPAPLVYSLLIGAKFPDSLDEYIDSLLEKDEKTPFKWTWTTPQVTAVAKTTPQVSVIGPLRPGETDKIASLRKLTGVYVLVEGLSSVGERILTKQQIQTDIELALRRNRIRVLSEAESFSTPGSGMLYLNLNVLQGAGTGSYAYSYDLELVQTVRLDRDTTFKMEAATWSKGGAGIVSPGQASTSIRQAVSELIDAFCNDFLKANSP